MAYDSKGTLNKVMLIGRLGQDPELKYTPNGAAILQLSVATDTSWKDQEGNQQTKTEWHRIVIWRKTAEIIAQYTRKGSRVYVEGRLTTRSWEDNGVKKYITEITGDSVQMLESKQSSGDDTSTTSPPPPEPNPDVETRAEQADDLPF
jgi:single-strand DNA-binding protein